MNIPSLEVQQKMWEFFMKTSAPRIVAEEQRGKRAETDSVAKGGDNK